MPRLFLTAIAAAFLVLVLLIAGMAGNSVFLDYRLRIPRGDSSLDLHIDDRMYLVSPQVIINESSMSWFGLPVGSIQLVIRREKAGPG